MGGVESDCQKEIIVVDVDATIDDQPILGVGDQSETDDCEGLLNLDFMPQA